MCVGGGGGGGGRKYYAALALFMYGVLEMSGLLYALVYGLCNLMSLLNCLYVTLILCRIP